jgi:2'-5' RNA ligase
MEKSEDLIRSFICLNVPDEWVAALSGISAPLKKLRSRISWTKSFHLTLKFLGEIPHSNLEKVRRVLEETVPQFPPFTLTLGEIGCFPGPRRPRVLWVGIKTDDDTLLDMQNCLEEKLEKIGFQREKRRFAPHLTLGRIRRLDVSDRLGNRLSSLDFPEVSSFQAKSVELMRSRLGREGAAYSVISSHKLRQP